MYNKQIEVSKEQFIECLSKFEGYIAHRREAYKFFIKIMAPGKIREIKNYLNI